MSKHRVVKSDFWVDEYIEELSKLERYFFLYLLTNPNTNILGIYKNTFKRMIFETDFERPEIEEILAKFSEDDKVHFIDNHIIMVNFQKHQKPNDKMKTGIKKLLFSLPKPVIDFILSKESTVSDRLSYYMKDYVYLHKDKDINKGKSNNKDLDDFDKIEEKKERLLQSLKEGMIQTWQYLDQFPEPELTKDAIEVIESLREVRGSAVEPGKTEIEMLINNWLFGGVEKDILFKMIKGAATNDIDKGNLAIDFILRPKHIERLLMKEEEVFQKKSKNFTEAGNIEDHRGLIEKEKEENEQYFLATVDQKLKIVLRAITGYGPYQSIIKEDSYREEIQKRIADYIKSNNTDRSTVMVGVNALVTSYLEELAG